MLDDIEDYLPRSGRLITEDSRIISEAAILEQQAESVTVFNERKSTERTPIISLSPVYPLSLFRDITTGTVTHNVDEYVLAPGATLSTAEIGRYVPGFQAEAGVGFRADAGAEAEWGYFNDTNGFLFRRTDANGLQVVVLRDGIETDVIGQANFNVDKLDGTGPSGININLESGYVFQINYTWYGYGPISFQIISKTKDINRIYTVHRESVAQGTSVRNPNLPIRVKNIGTTGNVQVTGRQFVIVGRFVPSSRMTGFTGTAKSVGTSWTPLVSFRRKTGTAFDVHSLTTDGFFINNAAAELLEYQILLNPTLTGASPVAPQNRAASETAVEFDTSATGFSGGEQFYADVVGPSGTGRNEPSFTSEELSVRIPSTYWVTIVARTLANTSTVTAHIRAREEF